MKKNREIQLNLMNEIIEIVSFYYNVNISENTKERRVSTPRSIASYLIDKYTNNITGEEKAKKLFRKRSNVQIMSKRIKESIPFDRVLKSDLQAIENILITESKYLKLNYKEKILKEIYITINKFNTEELLILRYKTKTESFNLKDNIIKNEKDFLISYDEVK